MARITFGAGEEFSFQLSRLSSHSERITKKAIYEAVNIVANQIKDNIEALPTDTFRKLRDGEVFTGLPEKIKEDLSASFGVTPIKKDKDENLNAKIGFDGYGRFPTRKYPDGVPNQLIARALESGSSVRKKIPFVRPAVNKTRKLAVLKMNQVIREEIQKLK